jgi:hypothetical protein
VYGLWVANHRVVLAVLVVERALHVRYAVLDISQPHLLGRPAVERHGRVLHVPPRHHLQHHRVGTEEEEVGEAGPVRAHEHVARVDGPGEVLHAEVSTRLDRDDLEPSVLGRSDDLREVDELPRAATVDKHQPWLPLQLLSWGAGRSCRSVAVRLLVWDADACGRQAVDLADVEAEVEHGVVPRGARRVDAQVAVAAEADGDVRVAPDAAVLVEVDDVVAGEVLEDEPVLVHEPRLEIGDEELHLALQGTRGDEERDEHVAEVVPRVGRQPVHREHQRADGVPGGALWRRQRLGGVQRLDGDLVHELEVLARLVTDAPFLAVRAELADRWYVQNGAVGSHRSCVAGDLADVVPGVGKVAYRLAWRRSCVAIMVHSSSSGNERIS